MGLVIIAMGHAMPYQITQCHSTTDLNVIPHTILCHTLGPVTGFIDFFPLRALEKLVVVHASPRCPCYKLTPPDEERQSFVVTMLRTRIWKAAGLQGWLSS